MSSQLSAEAPAFTPVMHSHQAAVSSTASLPQHFYTCYPFVDPSYPGTRAGGQQPRLLHTGYPGPRHMSPTNRPPFHLDRGYIRPPSTSRPQINPSTGYYHHQRASLVHQASSYFPSAYSPISSPVMLSPGYSQAVPMHSIMEINQLHQRTNLKAGQRRMPSNDKLSSRVSKATQNESNGQTSKGRKSKTIILVDTAAQTDFSDEIAGQTLEQVPNALYQGKRKPRTRHKTLFSRPSLSAVSTDSEELDSDSGYSSPMHRKNRISSGTDAHTDASALNSTYNPTSAYLGLASQPYHAATVYNSSDPCHSQSKVLMNYASAVSSHPDSVSKASIGQFPSHHTPGGNFSNDSSFDQSDERRRSVETGAKSGEDGAEGKKRRRKRGRRRRKKDEGEEEGEQFQAETPNYLSSANCSQGTGFSSPILSQECLLDILAPERLIENFPTFAEAGLFDDSAECKLSGKRKKRREQANKAAMAEQLEIDLEQQALKVVKQTSVTTPPQTQASSKRSHQPITINLMDMITSPEKPTVKEVERPVTRVTALNPMDSTAPSLKRGKEREVPKAKKPSALKKVILKEREEKKRSRYIISTPDSSLHFASEPEDEQDDDADDVISDMEEPSTSEFRSEMCTPASQDLSPVSQNSPISLGMLSPGDSLASAFNSPVIGAPADSVRDDIIHKIHSRRFREYCNQVLDKEIDQCCTNLLQSLVKFQDRQYHKDPLKAKSKRRLVLGLREVTKHLKLKKIKLVIISPNLERIQSKGGLDDALSLIIQLCNEQDVPFVFALGRRTLGRACAKLVPVSVVGVFNYQGSEGLYKELIDHTQQARDSYHEMCTALAKEVAEYGHATDSAGMFYAHFGHSRTPSGCSGISVASSILSEPPAYDRPTEQMKKVAAANEALKTNPSSDGTKSPLPDEIYDIDEGNEADTEDNDNVPTVNPLSTTTVLTFEESNTEHSQKIESSNGQQADMEPIDSIHNAVDDNEVNLVTKTLQSMTVNAQQEDALPGDSTAQNSIEIRSQTSSRTLELNGGDNASLHSTVTLEGVSEAELTVDQLSASQSSTKLHKHMERVESWVREIDSRPPEGATDISQDDVEFKATYTACEANTEMLISRSRSPSLSQMT